MATTFTEVQKQAWVVFAQTWVDTEYDEHDRAMFADTLLATGLSIRALRRICYWEVCGAFATFSSEVFASAGMALPDWYYPADLAQERTAKWLSRPLALSLLNPCWLVGYVLSVRLMRATMGRVLTDIARRA